MWSNKPRRAIHNQTLAQLLLILAFAVPLPTVALAFWLIFAVCPAIGVPTTLMMWTVTTAVYATISTYVRIKERHA